MPRKHAARMIDLEYQKARYSRKPCPVQGCPDNLAGLGPYCQRHIAKYHATGSPLGKTVTNTEFKKHREGVVRWWIDQQGDHPGIKNAEDFCDRLINSGRSVEHYGRHLSTNARVSYRIWVLRAHGYTGRDVLEGLIAVHLIRRLDSQRFLEGRNDRHFACTVSARIWGMAGNKHKGVDRAPGHKPPHAEGFKPREEFYHQLNTRIGRLARRCAAEIEKHTVEYRLKDHQVLGSEDAFKPIKAQRGPGDE